METANENRQTKTSQQQRKKASMDKIIIRTGNDKRHNKVEDICRNYNALNIMVYKNMSHGYVCTGVGQLSDFMGSLK